MTRNEYAIIATAIANTDLGKVSRKKVVDSFVEILKMQSPYKFKEDTFREWCNR